MQYGTGTGDFRITRTNGSSSKGLLMDSVVSASKGRLAVGVGKAGQQMGSEFILNLPNVYNLLLRI